MVCICYTEKSSKRERICCSLVVPWRTAAQSAALARSWSQQVASIAHQFKDFLQLQRLVYFFEAQQLVLDEAAESRGLFGWLQL
jgi:hypothetical protein